MQELNISIEESKFQDYRLQVKLSHFQEDKLLRIYITLNDISMNNWSNNNYAITVNVYLQKFAKNTFNNA